MPLLRAKSIKGKLQTIIMIACGAALVLSAGVLVTIEIVHTRSSALRQLEDIGKIVAINSAAPLMFNDLKGGKETLDSFMADKQIDAAALYNPQGNLFALYQRPDSTSPYPIPVKALPDGLTISGNTIILFLPVTQGRERTGTLFIKANLDEMREYLKLYGFIATLIVLGSLVAAFALSTRLQATVSGPIHRLTQTAQRVSEEKDYSLRAAAGEDDEVGRLIDRFNEMLVQIQLRDVALHTARDELESRVRDRTRELENEVQTRKNAEEKLRYHMLELERSNKELEDFAFIASHDLQEPLRKVIAFSDRLRSHLVLDEKSGDYMERIINATLRMQKLIDDLLKLSRITTKAHPLEPVDLDSVLSEVIEDLEVRIKQSSAVVRVDLLPKVMADRNQMRQLFQNLIANALKFKRDDVTPEVRVSAKLLADNTWEFCVEDNGIGFEEIYSERIFKPFERLQGRSVVEGTGIGLAICQKIVTRHGGSIRAKSRPGEGSRFIFTLAGA